MRTLTIALGLIIAASSATTVLSQAKQEGQKLAEILFKGQDSDHDGNLTYSDMLSFSKKVFISMDSNEDKNVSSEEFAGWDFGMANIAEKAGKSQGMSVARNFVFDLWDRNNDDVLTQEEQERAVIKSTDYADLNGDRLLSMEEYLQGFITNIGFRSALREDR